MMKTTLFAALLSAAVNSYAQNAAQDNTPLVLPKRLQSQCHVAQWHLQTIVDPFDTGFYDYRLAESNNGFFKNQQPKSPSALVGV